MAFFCKRLSGLHTDTAQPEKIVVTFLRRDKDRTCAIPYTCCWYDEEWRKFETYETVIANIVGWRRIEKPKKFQLLKK